MKREEIEARAREMVAKHYANASSSRESDLAGEITRGLQSAYTAGLERAAEIAEGLAEQSIAAGKQIREEWCGPDMSPEDRAANYQDARETEARAPHYRDVSARLRKEKNTD